MLLLPAVLLGPAAGAEQLYGMVYGQREEMTLRDNGVDMNTRVGRLGIVLTSIYSDRIDGSVDIGYASVTQGDNPVVQGIDLPGAYGGVALRLWPLRSRYLDAWVQGDYSLLSVTGSNNGQTTDIEWDDGGVSAGLVAHLGAVDLLAGARSSSLSGEERASGTLTYTHDLSLQDKTSYWAGVDLYVDRTGTVGVLFNGGGRRGLSLRFARLF